MMGGDRPALSASQPARKGRLWDLLLVLVLFAGAFFRFVGVNWDQNQHLHPDERFLTMVETSIAPVESLEQYFDTDESTLNPNNRGYGFYVYGTLPLFAVRYAGEWLGKTGYDEIHLVGRQLSALMDLGTVALVYLIAVRLYRSRPMGLLAAAFAALSVLPIQLSHYFAVDTFTNFFGMLAFYFAACVLTAPSAPLSHSEDTSLPAKEGSKPRQGRGPSVLLFVFFGVALGMAMASKINAVMLAALLPAVVIARLFGQPAQERERWSLLYLRNLVIAALVSFVVFRIFQPYAFTGPDFLNFLPNERWIASLRDLASQSTGDVDFPPALQWARRPIWFAFQNTGLWGLGLPLGILACAGFLWMGWRMVRGEWRSHLLLWAWSGAYFAYQSLNFTRAMRYQMLVYPTLAIIAAWVVWSAWQRAEDARKSRAGWWRGVALSVGLLVLALTAAWAFAFTRIYTRPLTRVEASRWIYQNVPGPINLHIFNEEGMTSQPVAFRSGYTLSSEDGPLVLAFYPRQTGELVDLRFSHLSSPDENLVFKVLSVAVSDDPGVNSLTLAQLANDFRVEGDPRGKDYTVHFSGPVKVDAGRMYYFILSLAGNGNRLNLSGPLTFTLSTGQETIRQYLPEPVSALRASERYLIGFEAAQSGRLPEITLAHVVDWEGRPEPKTLRLTLTDTETGQTLAESELRSPFSAEDDPRGGSAVFQFAQPIQVERGARYTLQIEQVEGPGRLAIYGSKQANESSWDDALPVGLDGYNPYDYFYGIYRSDLNFEMYWDDNQEKLDRFTSVLDQADYLFISSNRQWGTTTRVPERYPLTSEYYRRLLGCPAERAITWCYSVAQPGMFAGDLGFELEAVFQSDPNLGSLRFNDQFAEEAFTVYDHPKVLIFKKTAAYDPDRVRAILGAMDLSTAVHVTPRKAGKAPANLLLPEERLAEQQAGGTWTDLFDTSALVNRLPGLAAAAWWLTLTLLGWVVYPITRIALRGLPDRGYPLVKLVGMLLLAYPVWLLGSHRIPFSAPTITTVFALLVGVNAVLAVVQRKALASELRRNWKYFLAVEALALAFFFLFLLVRTGNPDLWHPYKGGEKPMDFSYFNAVLKSTTFPPYDPWFAGGYINYYYYGYVLVGVPVKWLGIVPSIAYNLILPALFSILALGAFSVGWNLLTTTRPHTERPLPGFAGFDPAQRSAPWIAGLGSSAALVILGNWGTVRMIWHGVQRLANMQVPFEEASLLTRLGWTAQGLWRLLTIPGTRLAYGAGDWYWIPSRAIPGEPITEFPAFTFLYADLHAHMIALPVTLLALSWALALLFNRWSWRKWWQAGISFLLGSLVIGTLKPTNTWDWPTFLALSCLAVAYSALRWGHSSPLRMPGEDRLNCLSRWAKPALLAGFGVLLLAGLSALLFQPYSDWYGQGYNQIDVWKGAHTPFWSYTTHWGVFLFVIASWMTGETIDWMAKTPVSALNRLRKWRAWITAIGIGLAGLIVLLLATGVQIAWAALLLAAWAGVLLLRPAQPDAKRAVLFMTGTALALTLFVEIAVLRGDVGRMNTVFKFYLQAWSLLALSAGAALVWLALDSGWRSQPGLRTTWNVALVLLVAGAALFPILAGIDKITDRMAENAPHTLDGMVYMAYSTYTEEGVEMDLSEDYRAIRWVQENVPGSPVIVEAHVPFYRWGNRFTIYTGLPGVVGWDWHQIQQRVLTPGDWVTGRVDAVGQFYNTTRTAEAIDFLRRYNVRYIVVGQLERAIYDPAGLAKFTALDGQAWQQVYSDGNTAVYRVSQ